jgi:hypothetical protein
MANPSQQPLHVNTSILKGDKDNIVAAFKLDKFRRKIIMLENMGYFDWIHPGS